jgi:pyridoxamine 5'-phosphate oxidase
MPRGYWSHDLEIATVNMTTQSPPAFYNDLAASLEMAWQLWGRGTVDRHSGFHAPVVTSVDADGNPQARTMILRAVDREARTMRFHTDVRSAKMLHWKFKSRVCILGYDASKKIQLRVDGHVVLHMTDAVADDAWKNSRPESLAAYGVAIAPGSVVDTPGSAPQSDEDGRENFAVVMVEVDSLEWIYLNAEGNRRAIFSWQGGVLKSNWLQP